MLNAGGLEYFGASSIERVRGFIVVGILGVSVIGGVVCSDVLAEVFLGRIPWTRW
jgi:hypothetical protein